MAALGLLVPIGAFADPIRVSSGVASVDNVMSLAHAELAGDGFRFSAGGTVGTSWCSPCLDGELMDFSATFVLGLSGEGSYLGREFKIGLRDGQALISVVVERFVLPSGPSSGEQILTMPFTATGSFRADHWVQFFGSGTLTATFSARESGDCCDLPDRTFWMSQEYSYRFEDAGAAPVPEPATLLLLGTGLAGALVRRGRKRGASDALQQ